MTDDQIALVRSSFADVEPIAGEAAALFYDRLFSIAPDVRPLFGGDMAEQGRKLMQMLAVAVRGLDDLDAIVGPVRQLGVRHAQRYGARPEHYGPVGEALLWTLEQGLGDGFTDETRQAWTAAYGLLSSTMIQAAEDAAAGEPTTSGAA